MKILYITTVSSTMVFFPEHFKMLLDEGHTIELACNCKKSITEFCADLGLKTHNIPFSRSPLNKANITAYKQIKELIKNGNYDIVHTHTPNASAIVRLACKGLRKKGLKVFYTAHGFHFYKGAPLKNWLLYYPVEWLCSFWTDKLITINTEDYECAKKHFRAKENYIIPGIGVDLNRFTECDISREEIRKEFDISPEDKLLVYVGELNINKNQSSLLDMLSVLIKKHENVKLMIVGRGANENNLKDKAEQLGISNSVIFTGFRKDIPKILKACDFAVPSSIREGFGINIIEAMASKLPVVAYDNRGHRTIIENGVNGYIVPNGDYNAMAEKISYLLNNPDEAKLLSDNAFDGLEKYSYKNVVMIIKAIYGI